MIECLLCFYCLLSFFFQAEDGIRDHCVTGVQTCALPILLAQQVRIRPGVPLPAQRRIRTCCASNNPRRRDEQSALPRSEERRVGKECRSRGWRCHLKKNKLKVVTCSTTIDGILTNII